MKNDVLTAIGQKLRMMFGGTFALIGCDGSMALWTDCTAVYRRVDANDSPKVRDALIRAACTSLQIDFPRLGENEMNRIFSAASWSCQPTRLCRACSERKALAPALGGKTIAEYVSATR